MNANPCADAHPAWVELVGILNAPGILRGRQRSRAFIASIKAVAKLVITYHGIRRGGGEGHVFTLPRTAMARIVGLSDSAVYRVLTILEDVGLISRVGELRRRCHAGTTSPNPGITGVCFEPLTFVIGNRFRSFFAEVSGTELAVSPPENHSEQERLSNLSESRTESSVPDSRRDSRDSLSVSSFLSALTASIRTKTGINNRNSSPPKPVVDVDAQIHAELALLREAQAQRKAKAAEVRAGGLTPSLFNHASARLR